MLTLPNFQRARVLVIGDVMLDRYWSGSASRISPEAPVPVVSHQDTYERPGGAANVAMNLSALGCQVQLIGVVGKDADADTLSQHLQQQNVQPRWIRYHQAPTICKLRVLSRGQQLLRVDFEDTAAEFSTDELAECFANALADVDMVVLSDYAKGCLGSAAELIALAKQQNKPIVVDPKGNDFERYAGATVLTPNLSEFRAIVGPVVGDTAIDEAASALAQSLGLEAMLVTRSEEGMTLSQPNHPALHLPTKAVEVFDVTGAGDTVVAALAASISAGASWHDAVAIANLSASVVVSKVGTATVTQAELLERLQQEQHANPSATTVADVLLNEDALLAATHAAKQQGKSVVMTNGCFDILHAGHVQYLQQAKALGDVLVLALNDDDSVRRLKGESRPLNALADRAAVLAALQAVDYVTSFSSDTPQALIAKVLPDVLVKGGDYAVEDIAGHAEVLAAGGQVKILSFLNNRSTTSLVEKIRAN